MSSTHHLDHDSRVAIVRSKDPRFDGWFVTGVLSTRIYCRPSCPAITPKVRNMTFYPSAAAAQGAGFRACKRCLPDATPGSPLWHIRGDVAARAARLVADGVVDREGVSGLSVRLGYSTRQIERLLAEELGAGPLALARAQRAQTARLLIEGTSLSMAQIALAAGFASIRAFNATMREVYAATPSELRDAARRRPGPTAETLAGTGADAGVGVSANDGAPTSLLLRLPFRAPLHVPSLFGHLIATAVPGLESWNGTTLSMSLSLPRGPALAELRPPVPDQRHIHLRLRLSDVADLAAAIQRCRRLLDLDADPIAVDEHLTADPVLAPLVASTPGVRLPGALAAGELAVRVVLSQQVSTAAASTHTARLVARLGQRLPESFGDGGPTHLFPAPETLAGAGEDALAGMPFSRRRTVLRVARALADGSLQLGAGVERAAAREQLLALPGLGPWSAEMILMRGLGDPDAFPATDLGVRSTATALGLPGGRGLLKHSAGWSPWRAYAAAIFWANSDHAAATLPGEQRYTPVATKETA